MKIGKQFIEQTKYGNLEPSDQMTGKEAPGPEIIYAAGELVNLPDIQEEQFDRYTLLEAINKRESIRKYANEPICLKELSFLLWCTQGVKEIMGGGMSKRTVPSAGARHALETFLVVNNVEGLESGLYLYRVFEHKLVCVRTDDDIGRVAMGACFNQKMVRESAVTFVWAAVAERMTWKYGQRAYRYLHLDAGHVCQNLYLAAMEVNCGVCGIAAFDDDKINAMVEIDGNDFFVIYVASVGKIQD